MQLPLLLVVVVASTGGSWIGGATTGQAYRVQMLALGLIGNQWARQGLVGIGTNLLPLPVQCAHQLGLIDLFMHTSWTF